MELVILIAIIGLIPAVIAAPKGHSFIAWRIFGAALFIVALPLSILLKRTAQDVEREQIQAGRRRCPQCAEWIGGGAPICRFCQSEPA